MDSEQQEPKKQTKLQQFLNNKLKLPQAYEERVHLRQLVTCFLPCLFHFLAFAILLTSLFGIPFSNNTNFSCLRILPAKDDPTWDANNPIGVFLGLFGSCYRKQGENMICTSAALEPSYTATYSAVSPPTELLRTLPEALKTTPTVLIISLVLITISFPLNLASLLSRHTGPTSPLRKINYAYAKWSYFLGFVCNFSAFVLSLSATLAMEQQFYEAAVNFERLGRLVIFASGLAERHLQRAEVGGLFIRYYAAYAFQTITLIASYGEWGKFRWKYAIGYAHYGFAECWPTPDEFMHMRSWNGRIRKA